MEKEKIAILDLDIEQVKGSKDGKEYNFKKVVVELDGKKFDLYPKQEDRKLFYYLLDKETN